MVRRRQPVKCRLARTQENGFRKISEGRYKCSTTGHDAVRLLLYIPAGTSAYFLRLAHTPHRDVPRFAFQTANGAAPVAATCVRTVHNLTPGIHPSPFGPVRLHLQCRGQGICTVGVLRDSHHLPAERDPQHSFPLLRSREGDQILE